MNHKYSIGLDYGTESGRALLVNVTTGEEVASHITPYQHGVIDKTLPNSSIKLGSEWALQDPNDYLDVINTSIPAVLKEAEVDASDVIGLGIAFTSCTMLPIDDKGTPLCNHTEWKSRPHSWVKLWKHHAAQPEADQLNQIASKGNETFLERYGGLVSSEWMIPKIMQIANEDVEVFENTDLFIEAADWVVLKLTNELTRSSCCAGYKSFWSKKDGYPSNEFIEKLHPRFVDLMETKLRGPVRDLDQKAGKLNRDMAKKTGLPEGIAVAVGTIDAHAAVPSVGAVDPGSMVLVMGTSLCHLYLSDKEKMIPGISGVVRDGIIPNLYSYEAGQPAVGDLFSWYIENNIPIHIQKESDLQNKNIYQVLEDKAANIKAGQSGLMALDWWNGNRSILSNSNLSGMIVGMTLSTKVEEIYRALLESTAFSTKKIINTFKANGLAVKELYACGGISQRNSLLMQIFADVTNCPIKVYSSKQNTALGAAMYGAVAAGSNCGGYDDIISASKNMVGSLKKIYHPLEKNVDVYQKLYIEYCKLHDYFGRDEKIMETLKQIKKDINPV